MLNAILKMATDNPKGVSFFKLQEISNSKGDYKVVTPSSSRYGNRTCVIWDCCSYEVIAALDHLQREGLLYVRPLETKEEVRSYYADQRVLGLPTRFDPLDGEDSFWCPCVIRKGSSLKEYGLPLPLHAHINGFTI